jgi:hypothetical protein
MALIAIFVLSACALAQSKVEVHGYMQQRFYANPDASARVATERVSIRTDAEIDSLGKASVELYYHPYAATPIYIESAFVDLPFGNGTLRVGKGRQMNFGITPFYGNRKTTQYGSVAEAFTQDRPQGIQYMFKNASVEGGISIYSGMRMGSRGIGQFPGAVNTVAHICEREDGANVAGTLGVAGKIGVVNPNWKAHISYSANEMPQADATAIAAAYPGVVTTEKRMNKFGLDATFTKDAFIAQGEFYKGDFSFLGVTGWSALVGWQPKAGMKYFVKYNNLDNDRAATANPLSWDTDQWLFGIVRPISKNMWLEAQYEKNNEKPGAGVGKVKNDLLFVELFAGF